MIHKNIISDGLIPQGVLIKTPSNKYPSRILYFKATVQVGPILGK